MKRVPFIITIDTEGDDLWSKPKDIKTDNAKGLYRFQELCNKHGLKPVYLTNYEMAMSEVFVEFGRHYAEKGECEIGTHLHAWNSPPEFDLTGDDYAQQPFLFEYPKEVIDSKVLFMTDLLNKKFTRSIVSHRAGRWGMSKDYFSILGKYGYLVDCSVTPGVDWSRVKGRADGNGGTDYYHSMHAPYIISNESNNSILEVPMTIRGKSRLPMLSFFNPFQYKLPKIAHKVFYKNNWLRPSRGNLEQMKALITDEVKSGCVHLEFMIHSSELSAGLNPNFSTEAEIEKLYEDLEELFYFISDYTIGMTLADFQHSFIGRNENNGH